MRIHSARLLHTYVKLWIRYLKFVEHLQIYFDDSTITAIPISVSRFGEIPKSRNIRLSSCGEISKGEKHGRRARARSSPRGSRRDRSRILLA